MARTAIQRFIRHCKNAWEHHPLNLQVAKLLVGDQSTMTTHDATDKRCRFLTTIGEVCWLMVLTLALSGCVNSSAMRLSTNPLKARSQILKEVPIGTPVKIAQEKMNELGFRCEIRKAAQFGDQITARGERGEY